MENISDTNQSGWSGPGFYGIAEQVMTDQLDSATTLLLLRLDALVWILLKLNGLHADLFRGP
jgi:hypothetical protein